VDQLDFAAVYRRYAPDVYRNFIVTASIAAAFWTAFLVSLWRMRARILIVSDRKTPDRRGA